MANLFEQYGIKEVADVTIYEIVSAGNYRPILYLDTLKVSTIEQTAEQTEARGGKGNSPLIIWDYGKEITVSLQDALFSPKSFAVLFGTGTVQTEGDGFISRTDYYTPTATGPAPTTGTYTLPDGTIINSTSVKLTDQFGVEVNTVTAGMKYIREMTFAARNMSSITLNADSFPGTYRIVGETYIRNRTTGKDEYFQFEIPQAKMGAENTITLEAEGDPSVFDMTMRVLRPADGRMMIFRMYDLQPGEAGAGFALTPSSGSFSKAAPQSVTVDYANGEVIKVMVGAATLVQGTDYTVNSADKKLTILDDYLDAQTNGTIGFHVYYNATDYATLNITVTN